MVDGFDAVGEVLGRSQQFEAVQYVAMGLWVHGL
jgi:hypothetical protein